MKKVSKKVNKARKNPVKAVSTAKKSKKSTKKSTPIAKTKAKKPAKKVTPIIKTKEKPKAKSNQHKKTPAMSQKAAKIANTPNRASRPRPYAITKKVNKPNKISEAERIEKLVIDNRLSAQKLGYSILRRWGVRIEKEELHSVIDYALCDSAIRYIPNKGASFPTYFYYHLRGHLIRLVADLKMASTTYAQLGADSMSDPDQHTYIHPNFMLPTLVKSELVNSPESLAIKEEELSHCSYSVDKLDKLEQAVLTRIYNNEPLTKVARSLGYSRCHISRIKQQALDKLKAIYSYKTNIGEYSNVTQLDFARKRARSRNKNKLRLSSTTALQAVA